MVDRTIYPDKDHTPDQAVRNIFGRQRAPSDICLLFAKAGLLSYDRIAQLGEDAARVRAVLSIIIGGPDNIGASEIERELNWLTVALIWQSCKVLLSATASRHAKMLEDPSIIPALPQDDHIDFRARFETAHPDMVITNKREPHKKFTERLSRDIALHGSVPFYEVGEIRLRSETIAQMSGLAKSADNLIKVARVDEESSSVSSEEEVMDRLHAFFMALEYLVVCEFSVKEGPMLYIKELQEFRDETKGLSFLIKADQLFRKEIARLMSDKRAQYPTFSGTLLYVLEHCKHLWVKARAEQTLALLNQGSPGGHKRPFSEDGDKGSPASGSGRKAQKKEDFKERMRALKDAKKTGSVQKTVAKPKAKAKGSSKGGKSGSGTNKGRIPEFEWTAVIKLLVGAKAKFCKFFNTSVGCQFSDTCKQTHACVLCGGDHGWFECPQRAK